MKNSEYEKRVYNRVFNAIPKFVMLGELARKSGRKYVNLAELQTLYFNKR